MMVVPHEHAMAVTGHDQTHSSAFFEYAKVYAIRALLALGTRVIGSVIATQVTREEIQMLVHTSTKKRYKIIFKAHLLQSSVRLLP